MWDYKLINQVALSNKIRCGQCKRKIIKGESFIMVLELHGYTSKFHNAYCNDCNHGELEELLEQEILEYVYDIGQD